VTTFVLDTDVLIALAQVESGTGLSARGPLPVVVTDVVWDELEAPGDRLARAQKLAKAISGGITVLEPDSPEAGTLVSLQHAPRTEGPGEHSVIAYCHHHAGAVAVLQDKAALRRGVEELRGRVLSFHGFVGELVDRRYIDWADARAMAAKYRRQYVHARVPVWWPQES
jgi:hypothetical protein